MVNDLLNTLGTALPYMLAAFVAVVAAAVLDSSPVAAAVLMALAGYAAGREDGRRHDK